MNSNVIPFTFDGMALRAVNDDRGEPWFIAMDVADLLDYSDSHEMTSRLDDDEKQNRQIAGFGPRGVTTINESGLYSAILGSRKAEAKRVKKWVTSEVLPSIRKTGSYASGTTRTHDTSRVRAWLLILKAVTGVPGVKPELAMTVTLDAIERDTGLPVTGLRLALPSAKVEEATKLNPTQIGAKIGKSAKAVNIALVALGFQKKTARDNVITDAGMAHGEMVPYTRHGHSGYQPLWYESIIHPLELHFAGRTNVIALQSAS